MSLAPMVLQGTRRRTATESVATDWPYTSLEDSYAELDGQIEQIPPHELAIHRGSRVEATDRPIGQVDEFIVNSTSYHLSHLVLRRGQLWGQKDITKRISLLRSRKFRSLNKTESTLN